MNQVVIVIPGEPVAQGRPRFVRSIGRAFDPPKSREWKSFAAGLMLQACPVPFPPDVPLHLEVTAVWRCPSTDARKRAPRPLRWRTKRPDADNILKAVADSGSGVLWIDDSQIVKATVRKVTAEQGVAGHVRIVVSQLEEAVA